MSQYACGAMFPKLLRYVLLPGQGMRYMGKALAMLYDSQQAHLRSLSVSWAAEQGGSDSLQVAFQLPQHVPQPLLISLVARHGIS